MGNTRQVVVGGVRIGGGAPIAIQSMSTFSPLDTDAAASQIQALHQAGADIIRVAVPDKKAAVKVFFSFLEVMLHPFS